jgi:hypothetical protein
MPELGAAPVPALPLAIAVAPGMVPVVPAAFIAPLTLPPVVVVDDGALPPAAAPVVEDVLPDWPAGPEDDSAPVAAALSLPPQAEKSSAAVTAAPMS